MAYSSDFWITVTTVAPVIGLTHALLVGRYLSRATDVAALRWSRTTQIDGQVRQLRDRIHRVEEHLESGEGAVRHVEELLSEAAAEQTIPPTKAVEALRRRVAALRRETTQAAEEASRLDGISAWLDSTSAETHRWPRWARIVDVVVATSWLACAAAMIIGLETLLRSANVVDPQVAVALVGAPTLTLAAPALLESRLRTHERVYEHGVGLTEISGASQTEDDAT